MERWKDVVILTFMPHNTWPITLYIYIDSEAKGPIDTCTMVHKKFMLKCSVVY